MTSICWVNSCASQGPSFQVLQLMSAVVIYSVKYELSNVVEMAFEISGVLSGCSFSLAQCPLLSFIDGFPIVKSD